MDEIKQGSTYKIMPFVVPISIRELGINKLPPRKNRISGKDRLTSESNLVKISILNTFASIYHSNKLILSLVNVQSIKPQENIILDFLLRNEIDSTLTTEAWLSKGDDAQAWVNLSTLNMGEYRITVINRTDRTGGGITLKTKDSLKTKL